MPCSLSAASANCPFACKIGSPSTVSCACNFKPAMHVHHVPQIRSIESLQALGPSPQLEELYVASNKASSEILSCSSFVTVCCAFPFCGVLPLPSGLFIHITDEMLAGSNYKICHCN